jgi:hypothetical protein
MRRTAAADTFVAWALVAAAALVGYGGIVDPAVRRTRATIDEARARYDAANRNLKILANASNIEAARARVERDLATLASERERGSAAALLRLLRRVSKQNQVLVTAMTSAQRPDAGPENDAMTIVLRGTYPRVLRAVAALSRDGPVVEVRELALAQTMGDFGMAEVEATVGVSVYRRITVAGKEKGAVANENP